MRHTHNNDNGIIIKFQQSLMLFFITSPSLNIQTPPFRRYLDLKKPYLKHLHIGGTWMSFSGGWNFHQGNKYRVCFEKAYGSDMAWKSQHSMDMWVLRSRKYPMGFIWSLEEG